MKKNLLVILLATFAAGTISADEDGGFLAHLGTGVKDIIESPAHIGQGGKKSKKEMKEEEKKNKKSKQDQESKRRRARRRQKSDDAE